MKRWILYAILFSIGAPLIFGQSSSSKLYLTQALELSRQTRNLLSSMELGSTLDKPGKEDILNVASALETTGDELSKKVNVTFYSFSIGSGNDPDTFTRKMAQTVVEVCHIELECIKANVALGSDPFREIALKQDAILQLIWDNIGFK